MVFTIWRADETRLKDSFSILHYIFNQGDGNSIAATSQTPDPLAAIIETSDMQKVLKTLVSIFAVIGILSVVVLIIYFSGEEDSDNTECENTIPRDTTVVEQENGIENFENFKYNFITKYNFQESRVKFPVKGIPKGWSMDNWTVCNWKTLTPYFMDTITYDQNWIINKLQKKTTYLINFIGQTDIHS